LVFEGIVLLKPVFTFIQNLRNKENLIFLLLLPVFLCLIFSHGAAASSSWEITPENPVVGDTMEIRGTGFEGKTVETMVTFEEKVQVQDGRYEYMLEDVIIPSGFDNSFTVQATGADDLNVRAKMLLWITKSAEAKDGTAVVSQTGVPPGTYLLRIDGKASGSEVKIKITARQEVEVDSGGSLTYEYNTKSIPAGNFEVKIGDSTKQVELQPAGSLPLETNSSSEQNVSEGQNNESLGDIVQEELKKSNGDSHRSGLKSSSEDSIGNNTSSMKNKVASLMGIKSILEIPKAFILEEIKPYIKANSLTEIIRNPPKVPSFLLGFAGTLLIGLAIMRKKK
jgi:hypothetical protein